MITHFVDFQKIHKKKQAMLQHSVREKLNK